MTDPFQIAKREGIKECGEARRLDGKPHMKTVLERERTRGPTNRRETAGSNANNKIQTEPERTPES